MVDEEQQSLVGGNTAASTTTYASTATLSNKDNESSTQNSIEDDWEIIAPPRKGFGGGLTKGHLLLVLVAMLYGTLNVSLRAVYDLPQPPSASALSTVRGWLTVLCFAPLLLWHQQQRQKQPREEESLDHNQRSFFHNLVQDQPPGLWKVAAELAVWNFGTQALFNVALMYVLAARVAFLAQLSVVMTPVLSALVGHKIHANVWWACGMALVGLILLSEKVSTSSSDNDPTTTTTSKSGGIDFSLSWGDILCLLGALSWSTYVFRVSAIGDKYDEVTLQAVKNLILSCLYTLWFLVETIVTGERQWVGWTSSGVAWIVLLYSALGPGTIADVLQQKAQSSVMATVANIIISSEPVFTAIFARILLGEATSPSEKIGGCLILVAAVVATLE